LWAGGAAHRRLEHGRCARVHLRMLRACGCGACSPVDVKQWMCHVFACGCDGRWAHGGGGAAAAVAAWGSCARCGRSRRRTRTASSGFVDKRTHAHIHASARTHIHARARARTHTHTHTHEHGLFWVRRCTYTHAHTHLYTFTRLAHARSDEWMDEWMDMEWNGWMWNGMDGRGCGCGDTDRAMETMVLIGEYGQTDGRTDGRK
jgi:hypothetical protein